MAKRLFLFFVISLGVSITTWAGWVAARRQVYPSQPPASHKLYPYQLDSIAEARRKHSSTQSDPKLLAKQKSYAYQPDSITLIRQKHLRDSLKLVEDSLSLVWIKRPDPNRPNFFLDSLIKRYQVKNFNFEAWAKRFQKVHTAHRLIEGKVHPKREAWILGTIFALVVFFALIRVLFSKHLAEVIHLFYSNRSLLRKNKDDNIFNSWVFLFLYILFVLTFGMYIYLFGNIVNNQFLGKGFRWFLAFSGIVMGLFTAKVLLLRLLAFLFDIQRPIKEHIATLYLFFSNIAIIFLPIVVALSLLPYSLVKISSYVTLILLILLFVFQLFRAFFRILFGYEFSIAYLFIYLCVLEICPVIILIKVLGF